MSAWNHFVEASGHVWMYKERHIWRVNKCCMLELFKYSGTLLIKLCQLEERVRAPPGCFHLFSENLHLTLGLLDASNCTSWTNEWKELPLKQRWLQLQSHHMFSSLDTNAESRSWCCNCGFVRLFALARQRHAQPIQNMNTTIQWWRTCVANIEGMFFFFFLLVESQKAELFCWMSLGKIASPQKKKKKNLCEKDGNCRAKCCWQNTGGLPYDSNCKVVKVNNKKTIVLS